MFDIKNIKHNLIQLTISGKITESDMEEIITFYKEKITQEEPINILLIFDGVEGITLQGFLKDMVFIKYIRSLEKIAILGDKTWLKVDAKIENLMPGVKIKQFESNEKEIACDWLEKSS